MATYATRYSPQVLRHLAEPVAPGRLAHPDGVGEAGSATCGDLVRIELQMAQGRITDARFQAYGCPATIAGASELVLRVRGRTLLDAARISNDEIAAALELSPDKRTCSNIAADALHQALEDVISKKLALVPAATSPYHEGVLIGMSGGVDSSVAALQLRRAGLPVVGVTFRLWSDPVCATGRTCCSPETIMAARRLAHRLGIPHLTVDLSGAFFEEVVEHFIGEYAAARTPNPCVRCNAALRFAELARLADRLGLAWIATGHYARSGPEGLRRGLDPVKDQSYVLSRVEPALLRRARFPLGELHKAQTRELARAAGLEVHDSPESQEICFIPDDDYRRFLKERLGERPGSLVTEEGRVVGTHRGLYNFTVGQRRGLGVPGPEPFYVVALAPDREEVVVGPGIAADVHRVVVRDLVRHVDQLPSQAEAQLRSMGGPVRASVSDASEEVRLELHQAARGIAPGQTAVLYEGDRVLAAGVIAATLPG